MDALFFWPHGVARYAAALRDMPPVVVPARGDAVAG
jgi:hypothetical protein